MPPRLRFPVPDIPGVPACAGNTVRKRLLGGSQGGGGRVCGEHAHGVWCLARPVGSSPRVRGTLHRLGGHYYLLRFIPACAGNTVSLFSASVTLAVHPRVCGEHGFALQCQRNACGSSPRVRGTRFSVLPRPASDRFIPACAGNTRCQQLANSHRSVHPRVCGEHTTVRFRHDHYPAPLRRMN